MTNGNIIELDWEVPPDPSTAEPLATRLELHVAKESTSADPTSVTSLWVPTAHTEAALQDIEVGQNIVRPDNEDDLFGQLGL